MLKKPILVFIPALMCDERLYAYQIPILNPYCEVKIFTLKDFDNITQAGKYILDQVALNNNEKINIVGTSMGGYIAMEMLKQQPHKVGGICLINTTAYEDNVEKKQSRMQLIEDSKLIANHNFIGINDSIISSYLYNDNHSNKELLKQMVKNLGRDVFINQQKLILSRGNYMDILAKFKVKTFIVGADKDNITPLNIHQNMHQQIEESKLFILKNCAHLSPMDKPEEIGDILIQFMSS